MSTLEVEQYHTALIPLFGLEETLLATKFHEIYLLTGFKDRPEVYIPLKMALATERLFRFQHILFDDTSLPPFTDPKIIEWREGLTTYTQLHGLCGLFLHLNLEQPVSCLRSAPHIRLPYVGFSLRSRSHSIFDGRFPLFIGARRPPNPRSAWILSSSDWLRRQEAATGATSFRTGLVLDREK
ncbi:MAG: hypothetical protein K1X67_01515 [Fimbriimonadaceae bacterium]|nr:hypothetical protein [Fimbriimonadaceae bacterium]